jgi:hypothetical protein
MAGKNSTGMANTNTQTRTASRRIYDPRAEWNNRAPVRTAVQKIVACELLLYRFCEIFGWSRDEAVRDEEIRQVKPTGAVLYDNSCKYME